jgi:polysaccharide deacetylase 2 family uncharacterized protein YibQ
MLLLLFLAAALPGQGEGRILLILDDMGHAGGTALTEACFTLPREVAFSILPGAPRAAQTGRRCLSQGRDQLAHLPWEPLKGEGREPFFMARDADADHMRRQLERVRRILPGMLGANNHQGSRASADTLFLDTFAQAWAPLALPFLDSRSTADSRIPQRLGSAGIPVWENHLFLDHVDSDEAIAAELARLEAWARERDGVIAIAHPRPRTLRLLHAWLAGKPEDLRLMHAHEVLRVPDPWLAGGSFRRPSPLSRAWAGPVEAPAHSPMED